MHIISKSIAAALLVSAVTACSSLPNKGNEFELAQASLQDIQQQLQSGRLTSVRLVDYYLKRIDTLNHSGPELNAVISLNPDIRAQARAADIVRERGEGKGILFGIPVLLKDNIDSVGLPNTGGSVIMSKNLPRDDAFVVQQLKKAGALILGKANLSEWANFRSTRSSSGWSGMGGQTRNPYDTSTSPCGSSSGSAVAVAADMTVLAVGTETDGSLVCPGAINGIVSIKPTLGLVSRDGIIPISHSQDTAGPMARTVAGAVAMLDAMTGFDPMDAAAYQEELRFSRYLDKEGLKGKRIGIVRNLMGYHPLLDARFTQQLTILEEQGAVLIDDVKLPNLAEINKHEFTVLLHEFKEDMARYLADADLPYKTLKELISANSKAASVELAVFGQELFEMSDARTEEQQAEYESALLDAKRLAGKEGIDAVMDKLDLDVLIAPTVGPAWKTDHINGDHYLGAASTAAAVAGYPHITVPMGLISAGESKPLPVGISFFGRAKSEPKLIQAAYSYEQASKLRTPPTL